MLQLGNDVSPCLQQCRSERLYGLGGLTYTTPVTIGQATVNAGSLTAGEMPARAYPGLDALRGIAALLVALFHFRGNFLGYNNYPSGDGYLAVDVFFVLSGFVLSHAYLSRFARGMTVWQFVKIRLIRLYPLYFIGLMLGMVNLLAGYEPRGALSNLDIARAFTMELFMLPSWPTLYDRLFLINVVSWSLFFEMLVNILFVVFWKRLTPKALLRIIIASGLIVAAFSIYRHNASMASRDSCCAHPWARGPCYERPRERSGGMCMDDILIDRLVLNIPGLTTAQAEELSDRVGKGLAAAPLPKGEFGTLTVDLNDQATSRNLPHLADEIVNSLLRQIG